MKDDRNREADEKEMLQYHDFNTTQFSKTKLATTKCIRTCLRDLAFFYHFPAIKIKRAKKRKKKNSLPENEKKEHFFVRITKTNNNQRNNAYNRFASRG